MNEKSLANLIPYQPGQSGNPSGKPANLLTKNKIKGIAGRFMTLTKKELTAIVKSEDSIAFDAMIASIILKVIENGDALKLDTLFNRLVGKVKEEVEMTQDQDVEYCKSLPLPQAIEYAQKRWPEAFNPS